MSTTKSSETTARTQPLPSMTVWAGEWPYVKRGVSEVRQCVGSAVRAVSQTFDVPGYLTMARKYGQQVDAYVTDTTVKANQELQRKKWVVPATAIAALSVLVVMKSAPWGGYKMIRNGTATAVVLTMFAFPTEIVSLFDASLPFSKTALEEMNSDLAKPDRAGAESHKKL